MHVLYITYSTQPGKWGTCDSGMLGQTPTETQQEVSCGFLATHTLHGVEKHLLNLLGVRVALSSALMGTEGTGPSLPWRTGNPRLAFRAESRHFPRNCDGSATTADGDDRQTSFMTLQPHSLRFLHVLGARVAFQREIQ